MVEVSLGGGTVPAGVWGRAMVGTLGWQVMRRSLLIRR